MALPIKDTPILRGKDAERFRDRLKDSKKRRVSSEDYRRAINTYRRALENGVTL